MKPTAIERFMRSVDTSAGPDACHPWTASVSSGYGQFFADGKRQYTHRWILGYLRGRPLESHEWALHHCDNPPCCNPAHLYVGSHEDNMADMAKRGRAPSPWLDKPRCTWGHAFTPENTYTDPRGWRSCKTCRTDSKRRRRLKMRNLKHTPRS